MAWPPYPSRQYMLRISGSRQLCLGAPSGKSCRLCAAASAVLASLHRLIREQRVLQEMSEESLESITRWVREILEDNYKCFVLFYGHQHCSLARGTATASAIV